MAYLHREREPESSISKFTRESFDYIVGPIVEFFYEFLSTQPEHILPFYSYIVAYFATYMILCAGIFMGVVTLFYTIIFLLWPLKTIKFSIFLIFAVIILLVLIGCYIGDDTQDIIPVENKSINGFNENSRVRNTPIPVRKKRLQS